MVSYGFYMAWAPQYALLLFAATLISYLSAIKIANSSHARVFLVLGIVLNISILFFFKYVDFALTLLQRLCGTIGIHFVAPVFSILLPVGISFYTFQSIGYMVDVYRDPKEVERNFLSYMLFMSFFPQITSGPIARAKNLLPQLNAVNRASTQQVSMGLKLMLIGYFKKIVLADTIGVFVNQVYADISAYSGLTVLAVIIGYTIQIYCDFSGYSDIAIGAARTMGIHLQANFNAPYFAYSIKDFWRRWHISLSSWLRDYIYIPLGGNRKGFVRKLFNTFMTFFISGLWHGANLTFIVWGILHGMFQIIEDIATRIIKKSASSSQPRGLMLYIRRILTFAAVSFAWIFFRASDISQAFSVIHQSLTGWSLSLLIADYKQILSQAFMASSTLYHMYFYMMVISLIILFLIDCYQNRHYKDANAALCFRIFPSTVRWIVYLILGIFIVFFFILQNGIFGQMGQFIYFQF